MKRTSPKTGNQYIPFNLDLVFGMKNLLTTGYVMPFRGGSDIEFSEKVQHADYTEFPTVQEEVEDDKQDSLTNTYKRGDLLKMHTYNDAIRRTVGSYVLYPGDFDSKTKNYRLFEEVLPGVGAFAIKPSIQTDSENAVFIRPLDLLLSLMQRQRTKIIGLAC